VADGLCVCAVLESDRSQIATKVNEKRAESFRLDGPSPLFSRGTEHGAIQKAQAGIALLCTSITPRIDLVFDDKIRTRLGGEYDRVDYLLVAKAVRRGSA
jgi:hypothetical protein